ncbi:AAA family ATPase [Cupriavidus sp. WGlv3]|uniref:AAA family ATPase n=1 Tax=Cupriavidus sp. WGlv3 TaxID=2919924 RepID=UPI002091D1EB|nr:AAA family ATPase [Cupriavidus sp. WGlv3]MCO4861258.1 AAA family ATPase [Cupriavidus sp. WGlv3]
MADLIEIQEAVKSHFHNVTEVQEGVLRVERTYAEKAFAVLYFDFNDNLLERVEDLRSYQETLIGPDYFDTSETLRWNNYLYFIAGLNSQSSSEYANIKARIEANKDYARKYVLSANELLDVLAESPLFAPQSDFDTSGVVDAWISLLEQRQLNLLLDRPPRARAIDRIENGHAVKPIAKKAPSSLSAKDQALSEGFLRQLEIVTFRPVHNGRSFRFGDVNLIVGPNGVGKTSLLEAIEYLYCGHNRRGTDVGTHILRGTVQLPGSDSEFAVASTSEAGRLKSRNLAWYRTEAHQSKGILDNFTRYNFLDTDAAHRIARELDHSSLHDDLRRLLVGMEASTLWDYFEKLKADIATRRREIQREVETEAVRCSALKREVDQAKRAPTEATSLAMNFRAQLRALGWKVPEMRTGEALVPEERKPLELVLLFITKIRSLISGVDVTPLALRDYTEALAAIHQRASPVEAKRKHLNAVIKENRERLSNFSEIGGLLDEWLSYCKAGLPGLVREARHWDVEVKECRHRLGQLAGIVLSPLPDELAHSPLQTALERCQSRVFDAQTEVMRAESTLGEIQSIRDSLAVAIAQLQAAARVVAKEGGSPELCPVCETPHEPEILHAKIEKLNIKHASAGVEQLVSHVQRSKEREIEARRIQKDLKHLLSVAKNLNLNPALATAEQILTTLRNAELALKRATDGQTATQEKMNAVKRSGLSSARMETLYPQVRDAFEEGDDVEDVGFIQNALLQISGEQEDLRAIIEHLTGEMAEISAELRWLIDSDLMPSQERNLEHQEIWPALERNLERFESALKFVGNIREFSDWPNELPMADMESDVNAAAEAFDKALHALNAEKEALTLVNRLKKNYEEASTRLEEKKAQSARLVSADAVLAELAASHSLDSAMEGILSNIKVQIDDVFGRIHSPREYEFAVSSSEHLLRLRGTNSTRGLDQVSTGQRAAFALSVFLSLNSTARSAPPVLLIDDPIAHIDDMNALSFLDYLRDLVLNSHRQVFFATADAKVAALFEKKFMFLGAPRFKKISLSRQMG